jgi:predicted MFS family arabinose efflux permease
MPVASVLAGLLWDYYGPAFTFIGGILFCLLTLVAIRFKGGRDWAGNSRL